MQHLEECLHTLLGGTETRMKVLQKEQFVLCTLTGMKWKTSLAQTHFLLVSFVELSVRLVDQSMVLLAMLLLVRLGAKP